MSQPTDSENPVASESSKAKEAAVTIENAHRVSFTPDEEQEELIARRGLKPMNVNYDRGSKSIDVKFNVKAEPKDQGLISQFNYIVFYQSLFAEFIGTCLLVIYAGSYGLPVADPTHATGPPLMNAALGSGLIVASLIWSIGHVSGCHINPAVSIAQFVTGDINAIKMVCYIVCQLLGSVCGALLVSGLVPAHIHEACPNVTETNACVANTIGMNFLNADLTAWQGIFVEIIITFILLIVIYASTDPRRTDLAGSVPLSVGLAVVIGILFGGQFTGGSMNPARSFGPAFVMNNWSYHYIYWIGPIVGAVLAALTYKVISYKSSSS